MIRLGKDRDHTGDHAHFDGRRRDVERQMIPPSWSAVARAVKSERIDAIVGTVDHHLVRQCGDGQEEAAGGNERLQDVAGRIAIPLRIGFLEVERCVAQATGGPMEIELRPAIFQPHVVNGSHISGTSPCHILGERSLGESNADAQ